MPRPCFAKRLECVWLATAFGHIGEFLPLSDV
jgi:hypothetical protein